MTEFLEVSHILLIPSSTSPSNLRRINFHTLGTSSTSSSMFIFPAPDCHFPFSSSAESTSTLWELLLHPRPCSFFLHQIAIFLSQVQLNQLPHFGNFFYILVHVHFSCTRLPFSFLKFSFLLFHFFKSFHFPNISPFCFIHLKILNLNKFIFRSPLDFLLWFVSLYINKYTSYFSW